MRTGLERLPIVFSFIYDKLHVSIMVQKAWKARLTHTFG